MSAFEKLHPSRSMRKELFVVVGPGGMEDVDPSSDIYTDRNVAESMAEETDRVVRFVPAREKER